MKRAILAELLTACRDKKPAALVTVLASGQQTIVYPHTEIGRASCRERV